MWGVLFIVGGCLVPLKRIDRDVGVVRTEERDGKQEGGPVATYAAVKGEHLELGVDGTRECRAEKWKHIREEHRLVTREEGRFAADWAWAGLLAGASVALWSVADPQTELGSLPFAGAVLLTPAAAIQFGTAVRTTIRIGAPTYTTRPELASAADWVRCGTYAYEGHVRGGLLVSGEGVPLGEAKVAEGAVRYSTAALDSDAWATTDWQVQLQAVEKVQEPVSKPTKKNPAPKTKTVSKPGKIGPFSSVVLEGADLKRLRAAALTREARSREAAAARAERRKCTSARSLLSFSGFFDCIAPAADRAAEVVGAGYQALDTVTDGALSEAMRESAARGPTGGNPSGEGSSGSAARSGSSATSSAKKSSDKAPSSSPSAANSAACGIEGQVRDRYGNPLVSGVFTANWGDAKAFPDKKGWYRLTLGPDACSETLPLFVNGTLVGRVAIPYKGYGRKDVTIIDGAPVR